MKKILFFNSLILFAFLNLVEKGVSDEWTVILFHFEEEEGKIVRDSSANKFKGEVTGGKWVEGKKGKALEWSEENGNIRVKDFGDSPLDITDEITLEAWIYLKSYPTGEKPFSIANVITKVDSYFISISKKKVIYAGVKLLGSERPMWWVIEGNRTVPLNQWTHIAFTYDSKSREGKVYINGELDKEVTLKGYKDYKIQTNDNHLTIRSYSGADEKFIGIIDEVRISNIARREFLLINNSEK